MGGRLHQGQHIVSGFKAAQTQAAHVLRVARNAPKVWPWISALALILAVFAMATFSLIQKFDAALTEQRAQYQTLTIALWQKDQVRDDAPVRRGVAIQPTGLSGLESAKTLSFEHATASWGAEFNEPLTQWKGAAGRLNGWLKGRSNASATSPQPLLEQVFVQSALTWEQLITIQQAVDAWWAILRDRPDSGNITPEISDTVTQMETSASALLKRRSEIQALDSSAPAALPVWNWMWLKAPIEISLMALAIAAIALLVWRQSRHSQAWAKQIANPMELLQRALNVAELKQDDIIDLINQMQDVLSENLEALSTSWSLVAGNVNDFEDTFKTAQNRPMPSTNAGIVWPNPGDNEGFTPIQRLQSASNLLQRIQIKLRSGDRSNWVFSELDVFHQNIGEAINEVEKQREEITRQIDSAREMHTLAIAHAEQAAQLPAKEDWHRLRADVEAYQSQLERSTKALWSLLRQLDLHTRVLDQDKP